MSEESRYKRLLMAVYNNPYIIDEYSCKFCPKKKECNDDMGTCPQTDEEAIELFIKHYPLEEQHESKT